MTSVGGLPVLVVRDDAGELRGFLNMCRHRGSPLADGWKKSAELSAVITDHTAQRRWGATTDLAGAYQFLASDASAFITGTVLSVDGGYLLV